MEIHIAIDRESLKKVKEYVADERFKKALQNTLISAGLQLERDIVENIVERATNTGALAQSWQTQARAYDTVVVFSNLLYAPFVEYGTRPHLPPFDPIRKWVHEKFQLSGKKLDEVAAKVRWKIFRKGTSEKRYLRDAVEKFNLSAYIDELIREWENV
jgi:hypothetical protein